MNTVETVRRMHIWLEEKGPSTTILRRTVARIEQSDEMHRTVDDNGKVVEALASAVVIVVGCTKDRWPEVKEAIDRAWAVWETQDRTPLE